MVGVLIDIKLKKNNNDKLQITIAKRIVSFNRYSNSLDDEFIESKQGGGGLLLSVPLPRETVYYINGP